MGTLALTNAFIYASGHDFTADANQLSLTVEAAQNDKTTFRSNGWREFNNGLKTSQLQVSGFWQAGTNEVDANAFDNIGAAGVVTTIGDVETEGQPAFMLKQIPLTYQLGGQLGENAPFSLSGSSSDGVGAVRGNLVKEMGVVSATGATGTGVQLGAVGASQFLYATFHVFSAGTTITAVVESDDNAGFSSATTRITFGPITTTGGTWGTRVAGAITDDYYRLRVTAITGTFTIAAAVGIQ